MPAHTIRFIHKISPSSADVTDTDLPHDAFKDRRTLGRALRSARVLPKGGTVHSFRVENDRIVVFPAKSVWHSLIITPAPVIPPTGCAPR